VTDMNIKHANIQNLPYSTIMDEWLGLYGILSTNGGHIMPEIG